MNCNIQKYVFPVGEYGNVVGQLKREMLTETKEPGYRDYEMSILDTYYDNESIYIPAQSITIYGKDKIIAIYNAIGEFLKSEEEKD